MIEVEGYKAFRGVMRIVPKSGLVEPFELEGNWLYNPMFDCWYGCGKSFLAKICEVVKEKEFKDE